MNRNQNKLTVLTAGGAVVSWAKRLTRRSSGPGGDKARINSLFVCELAGEQVHGACARRGRSGVRMHHVSIGEQARGEDFQRRLGQGTFVVGLLPKRGYLAKVLEVPTVAPREVPQLLELEVEAYLPRDFGAVQISYRPLPGAREGFSKYEVYVAKAESIREHLDRLAERGVRPISLLPVSVAWESVFARHDDVNMFIVDGAVEDKLEVAVRHTDGSLSVQDVDDDPESLIRGVTEGLAYLRLASGQDDGDFAIGWLGEQQPPESVRERVTLKTARELLGDDIEYDAASARLTFLRMVGASLLDAGPLRFSQTAIEPRRTALTGRRKAFFTALATGAAGIVLAMLMGWAALAVRTGQYRCEITALSRRIELIKVEGDRVGRRMEQLQAVGATRRTRRDFQRVLSGLYGATPQGVSYSHVELRDAGDIRLSGQADSIALPFLLPGELESLPIFEQVVIRDAGHVKKAGGTVAEFRIDCTLTRGGAQ